ncbi:YnbE-like lipoprotein [Tistlia consotensis]|uniref:YnbE-like lipoprotein n=1 Tax=Tistlia consotensis USBA 355 TaxID=560819 RepID=A0A1Y6CMY6_9PROT|nr:YnbE family lipoprotein [Tistlia consotensis]SMF77841.1 YnbE-like lipoprotein [Tistlia consotensis USBA 355]SNS20350.1 YnbE-like lipoprotein [Tistlia consotensis]
MTQHILRPDAAPSRRRAATRALQLAGGALAAAALLGVAACEPTVRVEAPKEPITINLNIKLDADVRVRLEKRAREDIDKNPAIF